MKRSFASTILRCAISLVIYWPFANVLAAHREETVTINPDTPPSAGAYLIFQFGSGLGLVIHVSDMGTILLKKCDLDENGNVTPAELKRVVAVCFKLWDTNIDGSVGEGELSTSLKELFIPPPSAVVYVMSWVNGVAIGLSPDAAPALDAQLTRRILEGADSNKDAVLTIKEVSAFLLGKC